MRAIVGSLVLVVALFSCKEEANKHKVVQADFSKINLTLEEFDSEVGVWGGSGKVKFQPLRLERANFELMDKKISIEFDSIGNLAVHPSLLGLPSRWPSAEKLDIQINNLGVPFELKLELTGLRSRIDSTFSIGEGINHLIFEALEVPLLGGLESEVLSISFSSSSEAKFMLNALSLLFSQNQKPLVDQWGQIKTRTYSNKVLNDAGLSQNTSSILKDWANSFKTDPYGGYIIKDQSNKKTGFFYVKKQDENWQMISPEGNPFYSLGLNGVRRKSTLNNAALTRIKGREALFEVLPEYSACPECFSPDSAYFSFYCWNVKRKYGDYNAWRDRTKYRMNQIGFNTVGNWSDTLMMKAQMPYTYTLDSRAASQLSAGHHLPDVFHPQFEKRLKQSFSEIQDLAEDPYLIGYFVDNEMGWAGIADLDSTSASFRYLQDFPKEEWQQIFSEQYFSVIKRTIQKYDSNHLYLGCRFTRNNSLIKDVVRTGAKYLDVLSVNIYSPFTKEEMDAWYELTNKPILIGEHHVPPDTKRALLPRYQAFNQQSRDRILTDYLDRWSKLPYAVGSHWYQFADQEVAGRSNGGENQPVGIVSITDKLDSGLVSRFHSLSEVIYSNVSERLER